MKNSVKIWCLLSLLIGFHVDIHAGCAVPDTGVRVWDIVSEDFVISCETFSVVSGIDSKIDDLDLGELLSKVDIVDSKADVIIDLDESILSKVDTAESCCSQVDLILSEVDIIDSKADVIISKIDGASSPCAPEPVTSSNLTIASPGVYCLSEDVVGIVSITASDVTFDLNGHTIAGAINVGVMSGLVRNIIIRNGTIVPSGSATSTNGMNIGGASFGTVENILLQGLAIYGAGSPNFQRGMAIQTASQVDIVDVYITGASEANLYAVIVSRLNIEASDFSSATALTGYGASLISIDTFTIRGCIFYNNPFYGLSCIDGHGGIITDCLYSNNDTSGIYLRTTVSSSIMVTNCIADLNNIGFTAQDAQDIQFINCQATGNDGGFVISGASQGISLVNCAAMNTQSVAGFHIQDSAQGIVFDACLAQKNFNNGFFCQGVGVSDIFFNDCIANENTGINFYMFGNGMSNINFTGCQASGAGAGAGFYVGTSGSLGPQYITFTSCQAYNNATAGFQFSDFTSEIKVIECQATANAGNGFQADGSALVGFFDNCSATSNGSDGFDIGGSDTELLTFKECVATDNGNYGFNDNSTSSLNRYIACYANRNTTGNYNPSGAPIDAVDATTAGINYWNNTFSS